MPVLNVSTREKTTYHIPKHTVPTRLSSNISTIRWVKRTTLALFQLIPNFPAGDLRVVPLVLLRLLHSEPNVFSGGKLHSFGTESNTVPVSGPRRRITLGFTR